MELVENNGRKFPATFRDLVAIGFRHPRLATVCFVGICLGSVLAAVFFPRYQAESKILVNRERVDPVVTSQQNTAFTSIRDVVSEEELNSEVEIINSQDLLRKVVTALGLHNRWYWQSTFGGLTENEKIDIATAGLLKGLDVQPVKKANIIVVSYRSKNPELAARVVKTVDNFYLEKHLAVRRLAGQTEFFEKQAGQYKKDLQNLESRLEQFPREQGVVSPIQERDAVLQKLNEFNAQLDQTRAQIHETEQRIQALHRQLTNTPSRIITQLRTADNPALMQQLKSTLLNLELKRTELLTKYKSDYPLVKEVDDQIASARAAIDAEEKRPIREETTDQNPTQGWIKDELAKANTELSGLQARATAQEQIVRQHEAQARQLNTKGILHQDLLRETKTQEDNYLLYVRKQEEARISDALDRQKFLNVALAEEPMVPSVPVHPRWMYGFLGALFASVLSLALIFTVDFLDPSFRTPQEVESFLRVPVFAAVPESGSARDQGDGISKLGLDG